MRVSLALGIFAFCNAIATEPVSSATLFRFEATGEISNSSGDLATFVNAGERAEISFLFDASSPDSDPSPSTGRFGSAIIGPVSAHFGSQAFAFDPTGATFNIVNDGSGPGLDEILLRTAQLGSSTSGDVQSAFSVVFLFSTLDPLVSDSLPASPDLSEFDLSASIGLGILNSTGRISGFSGVDRLDQVSITPIPLPASALFLLTALGGLAVMRRFRRTA
jgi:hypothetical protein